MSIPRRKCDTENLPRPSSKHWGRGSSAWLAVSALAGLLIALVAFLIFRPSWSGDRAATSQEKGEHHSAPFEAADRSSLDRPAAEFEAAMYGIADELLARLPDSPEAHLLMASVHRRFARGADEVRELQQCLALDADFIQGHYSLGLVRLRDGNYQEAEKHFNDAYAIAPTEDDVSLRLAQAQMSQGKFRAAASSLESYLRIEPTDAAAWCRLGEAYQELGNHADANRCYLAAIELNPVSAEAHYGAARVFQELGATDEAREHFEIFRRLRKSSTTSVRSDKVGWTDEGRVRTAIVRTLVDAGSVYASHNLPNEAEKCWKRASTLNPGHVQCRELLCRLHPGDPEGWLTLGRLYIQQDRTDEAEEPFTRVIQLSPQSADGFAGLAEAYVRLGKNSEEAVKLAQTAVKLEATAANFFVLAAACERVEDFRGAESALEEAVRLDPDQSHYREAQVRLRERSPK